MTHLISWLLPILGLPWLEADRLFRQDSRFQGGDAATSIDLGNGRSLWLFGDSFVGHQRPSAKMVRNAIAIQDGPDPTTAHMAFYLPDPAFFQPPQADQWLWPGAGVRVGNRLLLTFLVIGPSTGPLGFRTVGTLARWIHNPQDPPPAWRHTDVALPPSRQGVAIGAGAMLLTDQELLAFSPVEPGNHDVYLIRWPLTDVLASNLSRPQWSNGPVFRQGQSEFSVVRQRNRYLAVQTLGFGGASIALRSAERPEGPWHEPQSVFTPPETKLPGTLIYAAKAHPQLAGHGLAVTYCTNHVNFERLVQDDALYYPRFVTLSPVSPPGDPAP